MKTLAAVLFSISFASAGAAQKVASIDPGMSREQVVARLGEPLSAKSFESFTYLLYRNSCEKKCGMNDVVTLDSGKVVDAVFRSPSRRYTGTSSSPHMLSADQAKSGADADPLKVRSANPAAKTVPSSPSPKKPNH
jgi:hypothetical protein